ncbi:MAG: superoxide dismutase family protein [Akkermansiaceae bacterium]
MAEIGGLRADQQYSIRIHQFGDLGTMDAERVGESFDPGMDAQQQTVGTQQARGQANGMQQRQQAQQQQRQQPQQRQQAQQQRQQAQQPLGNLGTVRADNDGNIRVERTVQGLQLTSGETGILGRSVVIHRTDDATLHNPVAAGVIGISQDGLPGAQARQAGQTQQTRTIGQTDRDDAYDD